MANPGGGPPPRISHGCEPAALANDADVAPSDDAWTTRTAFVARTAGDIVPGEKLVPSMARTKAGSSATLAIGLPPAVISYGERSFGSARLTSSPNQRPPADPSKCSRRIALPSARGIIASTGARK